MRALISRQRLVKSAAIMASATLIAACGAKKDTTTPEVTPSPSTSSSSPSPPPKIPYSVGTLLVSNGTNVVVVGGKKVTFPTTVKDAAWSPDGSRIAFVDGDGNVCTARPDGSGRVLLTSHNNGVVRSSPTWRGSVVIFTETEAGIARLRSVFASGRRTYWEQGESDAFVGSNAPEKGNSAPSGGPIFGSGKEFAFQHQGAGGPEVWVSDLNQRDPWAAKVADGAAAEISPDGLKVAYVGRNGQVQVLATTVSGAKPVQVTYAIESPSHLAWTPDGTHLAFQTSTDVRSVAANVSAKASGNPSTQLSPTTGVPTFLRAPRDRITRISGSDPVSTSIAASRSRWPTTAVAVSDQGSRSATGVVLAATSDLAAVLPSAQFSIGWGPVLFTGGTSLDPRTRAEMTRTLGKVGPDGFVPEVTILGGTDAVSVGVESSVKALGYTTRRVSVDRFATAAAGQLEPHYAQSVFVVDTNDTGGVASAISVQREVGSTIVLMSDGTTLPSGAVTYLKQVDPAVKVYTFDAAAQAAVTSWSSHAPFKPAVTPVFGTNAMATLATMLDTFCGRAESLVLVDRSSVADVLVGLGLANSSGAALMVVDAKAGIDGAVQSWLEDSSASIDSVVIVDSSSAVGPDLERKVGTWLSGPLGHSTKTNPTVS